MSWQALVSLLLLFLLLLLLLSLQFLLLLLLLSSSSSSLSLSLSLLIYYLKLATVKLQQPPVWKEELPSHNSGPETGRAPEPLLLCMLGLPGSLQDNRLVRVGAPGSGGWGPGLGYDKQKLLHGVFQGLCTLSCCLDGCSNAIAEVHVSAWLGCNEVDLGN